MKKFQDNGKYKLFTKKKNIQLVGEELNVIKRAENIMLVKALTDDDLIQQVYISNDSKGEFVELYVTKNGKLIDVIARP